MHGIVRQPVGVVGIRVTARDREHPLRDEVLQRVRDARRDAAIRQAARQGRDQTEAGVGRFQQNRAAVRTRVARSKLATRSRLNRSGKRAVCG